MIMGSVTGLYAGIMGLLLVLLSARVIIGRNKFKVDIGDGGHAPLARAIRTQGNFIEYVPLALVLMLVLELGGTRHGILHTLGIVLILARLIHVQGFGFGTGVTAGRAIGASGTILMIVAASALALLAAFGMKV